MGLHRHICAWVDCYLIWVNWVERKCQLFPASQIRTRTLMIEKRERRIASERDFIQKRIICIPKSLFPLLSSIFSFLFSSILSKVENMCFEESLLPLCQLSCQFLFFPASNSWYAHFPFINPRSQCLWNLGKFSLKF